MRFVQRVLLIPHEDEAEAIGLPFFRIPPTETTDDADDGAGVIEDFSRENRVLGDKVPRGKPALDNLAR
jgi:hypothetical protein